MGTPLEEARQLAEWGFNVLPAKVGAAHPQISWKEYQTKRTTEKLAVWFAGSGERDYWIATGVISQTVVVDCDNQAAIDYWTERIGADVLAETPTVQTKRGMHYYFRLTEPMRSWSVHSDNPDEPSFDVRADKTGVVAPPSRNKVWVRSPAEYSMEPVPECLKRPSGLELGTVTGGPGRSLLVDLLADVPQAVGSGRNIWMSRVAGHYAKTFRFQDAYEAHCRLANGLMADPLDEDELTTTINSIWESESEQRITQEGEDPDKAPDADNGWLIGANRSLLTPCKRKEGKGDDEQVIIALEEFADFDIIAKGVVEDAESERVYDVRVQRTRFGDEVVGLLPAKVVADARQLNGWLAGFGVTYHPPENALYKMAPTTRLLRYLESQRPRSFRVVEHLGWHDDGFIVHEGVIRRDGLHPHEDRVPHPRLANWAQYRYGFAPIEETRAALREILTFHDETVCSVYGAWWAACLLKPQVHRVSSQFPFMALEAPSESGKTTGFFAMLQQFAGNTQGNVNPTRAALRDYMSAHQSGIVWIDDLDDPQHLFELLRQATGEGSVAKKGENNNETQAVQLVAPVSISGEALNLSGQKALVDRAIQLAVPSPTSRRSQRDPNRLQWADIVEFHRKHGDLSKFAGTIVQMALMHADLVDAIPSLAPPSGGRFGDKIAILRFGAGLLAALTGDEEHIDRVEAWCAQADDTGSENALTLRVLPTVLRQTGWLAKPHPGDGRWPFTPVVVDSDEIVWFSPAALGTWWDAFRNGRVELRTESAEALEQQARALGLPVEKRRIQLFQDKNQKPHFWGLPKELSRLVLDRSQGVESSRGVHPEEVKLMLQLAMHPDHLEEPTD